MLCYLTRNPNEDSCNYMHMVIKEQCNKCLLKGFKWSEKALRINFILRKIIEGRKVNAENSRVCSDIWNFCGDNVFSLSS